MKQTPTKKTILSWIIYDFANTIYSMNVVTMYFPLWVTVNLAMEDLWVSLSNSLSMVFVGITMPVLGVISDNYRARMPFLIFLTALCVVSTTLIGVVANIGLTVILTVVLGSLFFTCANYAFQGGLVFYNALLPDVSTKETIGRISGYGVAVGYFGSIFGMIAIMPIVTGGIGFLSLDVPGMTRNITAVASFNAGIHTYLDQQIDANKYFQYTLSPISEETIREIPDTHVTSKDTVVTNDIGERVRAIIVHCTVPTTSDSATGWKLVRSEKGWGNGGSFIPTALLFFIFAIPTFLFVRDREKLRIRKRSLLRISFGATLPAFVYLPFLLLFPLVLLFLNPVFVTSLRDKDFTPGDTSTRSSGHWIKMVLARYHGFVITSVLHKLFKGQELYFAEAFDKIARSISNTKKTPGIFRFLIAKYFYEEGVQTLIIFMAVYAVKVMGFSNEIVIPFFLVATTFAALGSFLAGYSTDKMGPKRTLSLVIAGWVLSIIAVILCTYRPLFWVIACFIGIFLGSTWTAARPLLISLVPQNQLGEFFGLYSLSGKAASICGPLIWGLVVYALHPYGDIIKYKAAIGALAVLMIIGFFILQSVPDTFSAKPKSSV